MTESSTTHPGLLAVNVHSNYVSTRNQAKEMRAKAAEMRRSAKTAALKVDAVKLRLDAKPISDEAKGLEQEAAEMRTQLLTLTEEATAALNKRMPPEFATWGIVKTRAYTKVLGVLVSQSKRVHPNLPLATRAMALLLSHGNWSNELMQRLVALTTAPRELPNVTHHSPL